MPGYLIDAFHLLFLAVAAAVLSVRAFLHSRARKVPHGQRLLWRSLGCFAFSGSAFILLCLLRSR